MAKVIRARQARDGVEQDDNVLAVFDKAFGTLDDKFGHGDVILAGHVEGRGNDFAVDAALHVGDFLGALVDEQTHKVHFGIVGTDGSRDVLEDSRLAGLGRRDDEANAGPCRWGRPNRWNAR